MKDSNLSVVKLDPEAGYRKSVIEEAEKFLNRCKSGEVLGFVLLEDRKGCFETHRTCVAIDRAILMCTRALYCFQVAWDDVPRPSG